MSPSALRTGSTDPNKITDFWSIPSGRPLLFHITAPLIAWGSTMGSISSWSSWRRRSKKASPASGMASVILSGGFLSLRTVASNVANFTDTGLKPDATYIYRVKAFRGGTSAMSLGDSDYSNEATAPAQGALAGVKSPVKTPLTIKPTLKPGVIQKK